MDIDICTFLHNIFINPNIKCTVVTRIQWKDCRLLLYVINIANYYVICNKMSKKFRIPEQFRNKRKYEDDCKSSVFKMTTIWK